MPEIDDVKRIGAAHAFPGRDAYPNHQGMTLREYAAIAAMQGLLANPQFADYITRDARRKEMDYEQMYSRIADGAVAYADALLAALANEPAR